MFGLQRLGGVSQGVGITSGRFGWVFCRSVEQHSSIRQNKTNKDSIKQALPRETPLTIPLVSPPPPHIIPKIQQQPRPHHNKAHTSHRDLNNIANRQRLGEHLGRGPWRGVSHRTGLRWVLRRCRTRVKRSKRRIAGNVG